MQLDEVFSVVTEKELVEMGKGEEVELLKKLAETFTDDQISVLYEVFGEIEASEGYENFDRSIYIGRDDPLNDDDNEDNYASDDVPFATAYHQLKYCFNLLGSRGPSQEDKD
jgi:hypothetical protein